MVKSPRTCVSAPLPHCPYLICFLVRYNVTYYAGISTAINVRCESSGSNENEEDVWRCMKRYEDNGLEHKTACDHVKGK